ncbi:MAG: hypothetical protein HRT71_19875 [Flavobacteriales bacterium]|nr:hypothetical protein [Flavobacteriales bacterium]
MSPLEQTKKQIGQVYKETLTDPTRAAAMLANPGQYLLERGVEIRSEAEIDGVEIFNQYIYKAVPNLKVALEAASRGEVAECDCNPVCGICIAGILATAGVAITACIAAGGGALCINGVAKMVDVAGGALEKVWKDCSNSVDCICKGICSLIGTC